MTNVARILAAKAGNRKTSGIPRIKMNKPLRTRSQPGDLGIEIEVEGENLPTAGYLDGVSTPSGVGWSVHADGSLRGGLEYTLNGTCKEDEVEELVNGLFGVFKTRNAKINLSNRCSLHVHYNVGGLKVNEITSIIALWTVFEEPLLRWWGDLRYKNHYCLSSKDESANVEAWEYFLRTGLLPEGNNLRYTALNLVAIRKYGSLEFRGGGGVDEPARANTWIRFLWRLAEYAKNNYPNPQQIAYDISERGPAEILRDICGEEFLGFYDQIVTTVPDFTACCAESFYNFQPVILGFPWDEWLPEISKEYIPNPFAGETQQEIPRPQGERIAFNNIPATPVGIRARPVDAQGWVMPAELRNALGREFRINANGQVEEVN